MSYASEMRAISDKNCWTAERTVYQIKNRIRKYHAQEGKYEYATTLDPRVDREEVMTLLKMEGFQVKKEEYSLHRINISWS